MDTLSGFKLLADSSDTALFASHPRSPQFTPMDSHSYEFNHHPLLGHDVQVVSIPSPSYQPPILVPTLHVDQAAATAPAQFPHQQHSPKLVPAQPQQASPRAPQQMDMQQEFKAPLPVVQHQHHQHQHNTQVSALHAPALVRGFINQDSENSDATGGDDEEDELSHFQDEVRVAEMNAPLEPAIKNVIVCLIGEYLNELISFRVFLTKIRQCLCSPDGSAAHKEVFSWILRCMLEGGVGTGAGVHVQRMATFLEENGATKPEIEASSAAIKEVDNNVMEFDIGEKRKRREKKSISRGLRSAPNKWCKAESQMLIRLVHENGDKSWKRIAEQLGGGKTGAQCAQHWKRVLSPQIKKGSWDDQEEELLLALVERYGQSWKNIAGEIKTRTDIQCRYQYQKSCLSRQCEWQPQEDALLAKKVAQVLHENSGSNNPSRMHANNPPIMWVEVAKFIARAKLTKIPRTALECKQRWYAINGNPLPPTPALPPLNKPAPPPTTNMPSSSSNNSNNNNFRNINYNNINTNFTMVTQTY